MHSEALRQLQAKISETAFPIADLRDEFLKVEGFQIGESRFGQLDRAYSNINTVGDALFEYLDQKSPLFGKKPDREVLMIAKAAVENAKILIEIARSELELKRLQRT